MRHALRQLHYLTVAAQVGSLRRTAEMCQVDQSNVSRALKRLEDNLGALFERSVQSATGKLRLVRDSEDDQVISRLYGDHHQAISMREMARRTGR